MAEGELVQGTCFAIASVFTPNAHRRRGYAAKMLSLLLQELKSRKGAVASTLYSDIGPNYYSKIGWEAHPSVSLVLDLNPSIPPVTLLSPDCKLLDLASTKVIIFIDILKMTRRSLFWNLMLKQSRPNSKPKSNHPKTHFFVFFRVSNPRNGFTSVPTFMPSSKIPLFPTLVLAL